jgi:hypothetical protein
MVAFSTEAFLQEVVTGLGASGAAITLGTGRPLSLGLRDGMTRCENPRRARLPGR